MSPRPRKATDEEVFAATQRVMGQVGPGELSLTQIAREAGVTAGALVQRFGSKRELLLAVVEVWADGTAAMLREFRRSRRSPLAALRHYVECMAAMGETPGALANHLAYLQMDLTDADFRLPMRRSAEATRAAFREWLGEAVSAGELVAGTDTRALARLVESLIGGSLLSWAAYQEGTAAAWVRRDLQSVLAPYRPKGRGRAGARRRA